MRTGEGREGYEYDGEVGSLKEGERREMIVAINAEIEGLTEMKVD